ncbi:hypothetical protein [Streptomyces sp. 6N223]
MRARLTTTATARAISSGHRRVLADLAVLAYLNRGLRVAAMRLR